MRKSLTRTYPWTLKQKKELKRLAGIKKFQEIFAKMTRTVKPEEIILESSRSSMVTLPPMILPPMTHSKTLYYAPYIPVSFREERKDPKYPDFKINHNKLKEKLNSETRKHKKDKRKINKIKRLMKNIESKYPSVLI